MAETGSGEGQTRVEPGVNDAWKAELTAKLAELRRRQIADPKWDAAKDGAELLATERLLDQGKPYELSAADIPGLQAEMRGLQQRQVADPRWDAAKDGKRLLELQAMLAPRNVGNAMQRSQKEVGGPQSGVASIGTPRPVSLPGGPVRK